MNDRATSNRKTKFDVKFYLSVLVDTIYTFFLCVGYGVTVLDRIIAIRCSLYLCLSNLSLNTSIETVLNRAFLDEVLTGVILICVSNILSNIVSLLYMGVCSCG